MQNSAQVHAEMPFPLLGDRRIREAVATRMKEIAKSRKQTSQAIETPDPIPIVEYKDIKLDKTLGTGGFSSAFRVQNFKAASSEEEEAEEQPVMKKLRPEVLQNPLLFAACATDLELEGRILGSLNHPNIIGLKAWSGPQMIEKYLQGSKVSAYLILDQLVGTLEDKLVEWAKRRPKFYYTRKRRASLLKSVHDEKSQQVLSLARALEHLHGYHILHRDIKPANIGFDAKGTLKIFDFDLARVLPLGRDRLFQLTGKVGSPQYMAPEVKRADKYNLTADVFSFGVVVYEIYTHQKFDPPDTINWGKKNKKIPSNFSTELRMVLQQCLADINTDRPHMDKVRRMLKAEIDQSGSDLSDAMEVTNLDLDSSFQDWENTTPTSMLPKSPSFYFKKKTVLEDVSSQRTFETEEETAIFSDSLPFIGFSYPCNDTEQTVASANANPVVWV